MAPLAFHTIVTATDKLKLAPLLDQLDKRNLSFRLFAQLSAGLAARHGNPKLAFNHVSVSQWFKGSRHPSPHHRQAMAEILDIPLGIVDEAFDSRQPLAVAPLSHPRPATIHVVGSVRPFQYSLTLRPDLDLSRPAVYEKDQWTSMFSVYPANLKRHLHRAKANLFGWIPDASFKPLIPYSLCLVLLKRSKIIPSLGEPGGFGKSIWFLSLRPGEVEVRFLYRQGTDLVTLTANRQEQRFKSGAVDPVGYVTGVTLFRLVLPPQTKSA